MPQLAERECGTSQQAIASTGQHIQVNSNLTDPSKICGGSPEVGSRRCAVHVIYDHDQLGTNSVRFNVNGGAMSDSDRDVVDAARTGGRRADCHS
ncbi:hypothetical protein [Bradyrhizobium vignae]|uniref:hypothetical protein n=1 Tax=Bradyrhizobium vignae TaxID=1549949 RepID=UPI0011AE7E1B|nr:hypothetical protein [Bradyrhizobium vignae]